MQVCVSYQCEQTIIRNVTPVTNVHVMQTFSALAAFKLLTVSPCLTILSRRSLAELFGGVEIACFLEGCSGSAGPSALFFCMNIHKKTVKS